MKLEDNEALDVITAFNDLSDWWWESEYEELPFKKGPILLVERLSDREYDSYCGWSDGVLSMVFLFAGQHYKVTVNASSYGGTDWNNPTFKQVTPKTRSVSYYE